MTFQNADGGPVYTIDFIARRPSQQPVVSPGVLDIVVTQHPVEDDTPEMTLRVEFNTELELGAGQVKMLRWYADRWLGRVR